MDFGYLHVPPPVIRSGLTRFLAILALATTAGATTIVMPTDEQLVEKAPVIVSGTVVMTTPVDRDGTIWTETTIAVSRALKGTADATITVIEIGGMLDRKITKIFGAPQFEAGESVLLFLSPSGDRYRVVDLFAGKFDEARTMDGRRLWLRDDVAAEVNLLDAELRPIEATNVQREASGFETFVRERVAGRSGAKTYGIENPILDTTFDSTPGRVKANFTLIDEPTVYRWFRFDAGQSAAWYHNGTQAGYSNGGLSELQTAMSQWVSYGDAKIRYSYAGSLPVAPKGLNARNSYNEVLFNDPVNEIEGSWNGQSGVVGVGGFNGVENGGFFTATFAADPAHPSGSIRAYEIVEGALTIQNGVSPSTGIGSSRLAEILSHEFGHTLGFGHSTVGGSLMWPSVTGAGPSLRPDDQLAARWLYPNGSSGNPGTPVPNAPSNLTVTVSGSNADLAWDDNANNEASQAVYLAQGNGAFAKAGDVATNAESVRVSGLAAGTYRAYVVAVNAGGSSSPSNTVTFSIAGVPAAAFTFTPQSGNAGVTTFTFTDTSSGTVTSRSWSFGDGTTSTQSIALKIYPTSGVYPVTLTVSGPGGSSAVTHNVTVSGSLAAQFSFTPQFPAPGDFVQFTDMSGGGPSSWAWSFGDGTTSTQQNPSKSYASVGNYEVTLTVSRNGVTASTTRQVSVANSTSGTQPLVATFDTSRTTATPGQSIVFTDRSTGTPVSWSWNFGDGSTSTAQNPSHAYAGTGTYVVTLLVVKPGTQSSYSRQIVITDVLPYRTLISAAAQTGGAGGTSWRTELSLFNAGLESASITLRLLPSGAQKTLSLAPRQSITYANTLLEAFNLSTGAGAVSIEATSAGSSAQLRVTSRTFTTGATGTYGQSVPEVQPQQLAKTLYVTGIQSNDAYRTNLGFVNRAESDVAATLTLYSETGGTIAMKNVTINALTFQQTALWAYFPEVQGAEHDVLTLRIVTNVADALSAYASVVDNRTQDPIYIQAVPAPGNGALVIPAVGRSPGANGTFWRSDVTLFNPNADAISITLRFNGTSKTLSLGARDTQVLDDILSSYGQTSGSNALYVSWSASTGPVVTSRTYTSVETGGTYGQSIDPIALLSGSAHVPGLRNDSSFRSNIGFLNGGNEGETFTVVVLSPFGSELARTTLTMNAKEQRQYSVSSLFPNVNASNFTLSVQGDDNAQLFTYGSMVDNASGDPVFFAGQ